MRKILPYCFFLPLMLMQFVVKAQSQRIAGGEFAYRFMGQDTVKITLTLYRNCKTSSTPLDTIQTCWFRKPGCSNDSQAFTLPRIATQAFPIGCSKLGSYCLGDTTLAYGFELNRYEKTVVIANANMNCCVVNVFYKGKYRDQDISNYSGGDSLFYLQAQMNRCIAPFNNGSPITTVAPLSIARGGHPLRYNNGFLDTLHHDSVSVELALALGAPGWGIDHNFAVNRPFNFLGFPNNNLPFPAGVHLNNVNGDFSTTIHAYQHPILVFKAIEWRKINGSYTAIGWVTREMALYSIAINPNNAPETVVNGSNSSPWNFTVCAGNPICLTIVGTDKDSSLTKRDTTLLSWNQGIPGSQFSETNSLSSKIRRWDSAQFCWTAHPGLTSTLPYYIIVKNTDDNCPVSGIDIRAIGIIVKPMVSAYAIQSTQLHTTGYKFKALRLDTIFKPGNKSWNITRAGGSTYNYNYSGDSILHTFDSAGTFIIKLSVAEFGCSRVYTDTVRIDCTPGVQLNTSQPVFICKGAVVPFTATATNTKGQPTYEWLMNRTGNTNTKVWATGSNTANWPADSSGWFTITIRVKDSTCVRFSTNQVYVAGVPTANFTALPRNGITPLPVNFTNLSTGPYQSQQWSFGDTTRNPQHTFTAIGYHHVWLKVRNQDSLATCSDSVNKPYFVYAGPACTIKPSLNHDYLAGCTQSNVSLQASVSAAQGSLSWRWLSSNLSTGITTLIDSLNPFVNFTLDTAGTTRLIVEVSDSVCTQSDTAIVQAYAKPVASFTANSTSGHAPFNVLFSYSGIGAQRFKWTWGDTTSHVQHLFTQPGQYDVWLKVWRNDTSTLSCTDSVYVSKYITVKPALPNGVATVQQPNAIKVFPNPATHQLMISWQEPGDYELLIYNNTGQLAQRAEVKGTEQLMGINQSPGLYHLLLRNLNTLQSYRASFVIQ